MNYSIKNLSPAELIVIVFNKNIKNVIRYFLKFTIYDLFLREIIVIQEKEIKHRNTGKQSAYFVKYNTNNNILTTRNILGHEKKILDILLAKSKWISFQEFVTKLSYFENNKFRASSKKYQIEKEIINELLHKNIFKTYPYIIFGITFWKKNVLSEKGKYIKNILTNKKIQIDNYTWLTNKYDLFYSNKMFFNSQFFLNINNSFDHYFQHGLDNMGLVVAAPVHWINTYPEPIE